MSQVNDKMDLLAESVSQLRVENEALKRENQEVKAELRSIKWQLESFESHKRGNNVRLEGFDGTIKEL